MPVTYTYQTNEVLTEISPDLILAATMDDPIFRFFPVRPRNSTRLRWVIRDNFRGLMGLRGLGGQPTRVNRVGANVYEAIPGVYGEFQNIDEIEMTNRAAGFPANMNIPIDVADLVADGQSQLTVRQVNRMKQICWLLAVTGTFAIPLPTGGIGHTESYTPQTVTVSPLWSTVATATPLKNFRDLQPTFGRGTSNSFMAMAEAWMNSVTANYLLANTNAADLGGKRVAGGGTLTGIPDINRLLLDQNVPQINIWDDGYLDEAAAFQLFIPDGKVMVVGKRPNGETPGEFQMTRNANNPNFEAAPYSFVDDKTREPNKEVPPTIEVHQGFNGGPVVERPTQIVIMTVA